MKAAVAQVCRVYYNLVVGLGLVTIAFALYRVATNGIGCQWLILASLAILTGVFALPLPGVKAKISLADTVICTNLVLFGPAAGALTAALDGIAGSLRCKTKSRRLEFLLFNTAAMTLSAALGGEAFIRVLGQTAFRYNSVASGGRFLLALGLLALVYYLTNTLSVAAMVALDQGKNVLTVWRNGFLWAMVNYVAASAMAGVLALIGDLITARTLVAVLTVLAPLYVSLKAYVTKAAEAERNQQSSAAAAAIK
jgi:uncharacterized membrane protein